MKKTYISPDLRVTLLTLNTIIANSIASVAGADGLNYGGSSTEAGITDGNVASDNGWDNIWGD